jgi:hypothetical protein
MVHGSSSGEVAVQHRLCARGESGLREDQSGETRYWFVSAALLWSKVIYEGCVLYLVRIWQLLLHCSSL